MRVPEKQTTTGLKSQNFVLLDKFLRGGHTYMVAFNVLDGITGQRGKASVYFNTSKVPECGLCTITPSVGVALVTTFQLTCSKWTPLGKWPLSYHLSYSIDGDNEKKKILIYSGYRSAVPFVLPPGLASFNHRVQIYVTVASGAGTKQRMQPSIVRVSPQTAKEGVTMEEVLLNKTVGKYLSMLREAGNEQGVRQFITALANSLNRLGSVKNVSSKFILRLEIRKTLLLFIRNLTVNDKNSAFQTCLALQTLTASPEELAESSIETASDILQHLSEVMQATQRSMRAKRIEDRFLLSQEFIQTMTRVTSNLIEAASILIHRNTGTPFVRRETKDNVLLRATEAAQKLIKAKLSMRVLGEQPLLVTTPYIWVNATQLSSVGNSLFSLGDVKFHMPTNLEKELNTVSVGSEGSCYGTMMTVYKENPFFSEMHHTKVGSLSISHCNGEDIEVRNLSSGILISIPHGNHTVEHYTEEFTLQWKHENIHVINQTEKMMNQSLHVHLEPLSILPPGFVVKLITSTSKPDSSSENKNEYTVTTSGKAIDLYLGHHQLINVSGSVFARVVLEDTAYYRIKSIKKGPSFSYLLSVKWMGCFYWNNKDKDWSSDGCEMMDDSTDKMLFCRCNHLTAFSGAFMYPPNSITIEDLRDTEKLKKAPVTMALVVSIMVLYLVLLGFCVRFDKHDKNKVGAVYINENTAAGIPQRFQITVQTGHWFGAGTSANVFLVLHDDDRVSDPIELKSATGKPMFERSSCDVFVLSLPGKSLSNIWKIHIWHDNSGEHPSWFLEQVVITDVNNGDKRFFNCNRWLAVDEADGKVECELLETSGHCSSFRQSFAQHSSKSIMDYHLWLSLFGRPSYSRFSRAQRLTCCVSLLLSFLCVNIAWYRPKTEVAEVLGIVDVTAESIWIGVLCSILALPVNLLWIFLFRYSRRSFRHHVKVYPISEPQTDTTELVSSSVLDQSLETVLILKNIGERKRWFQTVWELDDVQSDTSSCMGHYGVSPERASDSSSLGYNSGQGALSSADAPLPTSHAGLLETCDFLADIAPSRKKSMDFEKRSFYSVSLSSNASEGRGVYRSRFSLPHVCVYVAWFGCLLTAGTAGVFTVLYGVSFWLGLVHSLVAVVNFLIARIFPCLSANHGCSVYLVHGIQVKYKKDDEDVDEGFEDLSSSALHDIHYGHLNQGFEDEISRDEDDLNPALALRRRQRYLKFLKPPSKSNLNEARSKCVQSRALWNYTIELMVFILFLLVTCLLVASVTNPDVYHLNKSIKKAFLRSGDSSLTGPGSVKDAWKEISSALHENSASSSYTPFTILLRDSQSLLFGRTRITQYNTGLLTTCGEASRSGNQTFCHARCHAKDGTWLSLELNQSSDKSAKQLKEITDSQWINTCTREIDVEFAVYTPLLRAISAATLTVKASFTGKPECHLELNTFPAFSESMEHGYFLRVCKLVFVVLHLYFIQHEFFLALTMSRKYFTSFWRLTQLLTVGLTSLCILLYIRWSVCLYALLREVETTSQTQVYYYAKLVSWSQETLQASYGLLLFFLIIRCVYLLRPFRTIVRLGKYFANIVRPLVACTVVMVIFMMSFAHTGHLLFGRLHSAFKSFGEAFLLVSGFFRLEGVNRYQGPAVEEHPVLFLCYFALFLIGFCVFMRGTTAAVFVCGIPQSRKRRNKILADFVEDFICSKLQTLREKAQRRDRTDSTSDEEEDEDLDEELELELETYEQDAPFPMEHVLDEVDDQIQELSLRMDNLMGSDVFDDRCYSEDMLSFADSEDDVEYLYQAEQPSPVSGSGYDSDHSNMSAAKWQFSSSSSNDMSDYYGKHQSPGPEHQASARPVKFTLGGCELHGLGLASSSSGDVAVHPSEKMKFKDNSDRSCSSCYEMGRSNACFTDHVGEGLLTRSTGNQRPLLCVTMSCVTRACVTLPCVMASCVVVSCVTVSGTLATCVVSCMTVLA
ncbi:detection of nodal flow [Desmophyllum pertusum]|uniref:Detection of nodal flow n=1 Tax=Desmophyllum pertusum TaxID=174260 RepID=A0A9X0CV25_9CNID|nr:detection of nodal flow [Desmophyllum pertusum]